MSNIDMYRDISPYLRELVDQQPLVLIVDENFYNIVAI